MSMITGQGAALQIGQESTWGTAVSPTVAINFTSEGFKPVLTQSEEDSLVGGATTSSIDIQKKSVTWSADVLAKPENIGMLIGMALGSEGTATKVGTTNAYTHAFTPLVPSAAASLPKFSGVLNRHIAKKIYKGCKVDTMSITCESGDYMRISFSGVGKEEADGTSYYSSSLSIGNKKAFRFVGGSCTVDGSTFGDIKSFKLDYSNNLDDGEQTLASGYFGTEPEPQKRNIKVSMDAVYNTASDNLRENKYKQGQSIALVLNFISSEKIGTEDYTVQITLPAVVISDANPVIQNAGRIGLTIEGTATESSDTSAITITLKDSKSSKYLA